MRTYLKIAALADTVLNRFSKCSPLRTHCVFLSLFALPAHFAMGSNKKPFRRENQNISRPGQTPPIASRCNSAVSGHQSGIKNRQHKALITPWFTATPRNSLYYIECRTACQTAYRPTSEPHICHAPTVLISAPMHALQHALLN